MLNLTVHKPGLEGVIKDLRGAADIDERRLGILMETSGFTSGRAHQAAGPYIKRDEAGPNGSTGLTRRAGMWNNLD